MKNTTMNTGAASLLPCPFCGGADIQRGRAAIGERPTFHTYCNSCEAGTQGHPTREASDAAWNRRATPQADAAPIINGHAINDLFLNWSEWTTELGEAISRKNIDGFVSELRAAIAAGGAQEPVAWMYSSTRGVDLGRMRWSDDMKALGPADMVETPLYAAPLPRVAATGAVTELKRIAHELRTYNPAADEYKGEHIHKVWAREIEALLPAASNGESK